MIVTRSSAEAGLHVGGADVVHGRSDAAVAGELVHEPVSRSLFVLDERVAADLGNDVGHVADDWLTGRVEGLESQLADEPPPGNRAGCAGRRTRAALRECSAQRWRGTSLFEHSLFHCLAGPGARRLGLEDGFTASGDGLLGFGEGGCLGQRGGSDAIRGWPRPGRV